MTTLRQIADDTCQSPAALLATLDLDPATDLDAHLSFIAASFYREAAWLADGLTP